MSDHETDTTHPTDRGLDEILDTVLGFTPDRDQALDEARYGSLYFRVLECGDAIAVYPMGYGNARVCLVEPHTGSIANAYCYAGPRLAIEAAKLWSGEGDPIDGWHRNPHTGRRRELGNPSKETVRW